MTGAICGHLLAFGFLIDFGRGIGAVESGEGGFEVGIGMAQEPIATPIEPIDAPPEPPEEEDVLPEPEVIEIPETLPVPEPLPTPVPETAVTESVPSEVPTFAVQPQLSESEPRNEAPVGGGQTPAKGGDVGVRDIYIARLSARLNRFKFYPIQSLREGEQGVTVLSLVVNRRGRVLDVTISGSSGFEALDKAALRIVDIAEPMPRFDRRMKMEELRVNIPMTFDISKRRTQ